MLKKTEDEELHLVMKMLPIGLTCFANLTKDFPTMQLSCDQWHAVPMITPQSVAKSSQSVQSLPQNH